jgi:aromatic-L-amino-acid decarboxylase
VHGPGLRRTYSGASARELTRLFDRPLPARGRDPARVLGSLARTVLRHSMQMSHPRVFGLFCAAPLPVAAFADLAAAFLNQSVDAWKAGPAATHVEMRLLRWINDLIGFGPSAFGVLTSGGGVANTIALKMARDRALGGGARVAGTAGRAARRLRVYASEEAHFSIRRALDLIGLGERALVLVPADRNRRLRVDSLERRLEGDRRRGLRPMAVVATAGTTSTGNIDPLRPIAAVARRFGAHVHVDAAYGGALLFSSRHRALLDGLERADTVTIDPHKWLFQPFSLGALFARDGARLKRSFETEPDYLRKDLEPDPGRLDFYHYSLEGSRPFRGLKLYTTLQVLGKGGLGALVDRTLDVARALEGRLLCDSRFEICAAEPELATVCFRYLPPWARRLPPAGRRDPRALRRLNRAQTAIQQEVERRGRVWFPTLLLEGEVYFRFGIFNYRTSEEDVAFALRHIASVAAGRRL